MGNIEAVYFCIMEGVNPEKQNKQEYNKNAFIYACENCQIEML